MALLTLPDGRRLEYATHGPDTGRWVVFHHGTPGGAVALPALVDAAAAHGLGTVLYARPGYSVSTPQPGRTVASCAADVAALADGLGIGRFVTAGMSGGGPHALATAALLAPRCAGVASLAGVAPYDADGLDWMAGMGEMNVEEFGASLAGVDALSGLLRSAAADLATADGESLLAGMATLLPPADVDAARSFMMSYLLESMRTAVAVGIDGWRDDDLAFTSAWGFHPSVLAGRPVSLWWGNADLMVPAAHGAWLAHAIPSAEVHRFADDGHLSLVRHADAIFGWLAGLLA